MIISDENASPNTPNPITVTVAVTTVDDSGQSDSELRAYVKTVLGYADKRIAELYPGASVDADGDIDISGAAISGESEVEESEGREATTSITVLIPDVPSIFTNETAIRCGDLVTAADASGRTRGQMTSFASEKPGGVSRQG
jgi:hypothetical protein